MDITIIFRAICLIASLAAGYYVMHEIQAIGGMRTEIAGYKSAITSMNEVVAKEKAAVDKMQSVLVARASTDRQINSRFDTLERGIGEISNACDTQPLDPALVERMRAGAAAASNGAVDVPSGGRVAAGADSGAGQHPDPVRPADAVRAGKPTSASQLQR